MALVKLAASENDIDTSDNLMIVEAFQKAVILNGTNKKIADFINSKITTANVGANPPDFQTELTGDSSGAKMTVDYITTLSGACTIYGRRTTEDTFVSGDVVTGTDDDSNAISFTLNADETAGPHWYNFTPFGNSTTFGALPTQLYLGALYLGRLYLAGDPTDPYQWYASRQGCIWDHLYDQDDAQSAAKGGDVEFGKLQDIVRSLIPCGNDYLLFGCHGSIYAMIGDPRQGGSMKRVTGSTGVFGARSWCFDEDDNLYVFGTGGIYRVAKDLTGVENLTQLSLPDLIHDESTDPSTHRITMAFDKRRHGIVVAIVDLLTRVNSCYWYDITTRAFYPEQYPEECAPYSMLYYDSTTIGDRDLLIGCADGYIRRPDNSDKDDDIGGSDEAIDSYVTFGPFQLGANLGEDGIVSGVYGILAGGATGGSGSDSSNVSYYVYVGDSPEEVQEKVDADTYEITGTVYAPGFQRGKRQRKRARGKYAAVRLRNNTAGQTWGFEEIEVEAAPAGRL